MTEFLMFTLEAPLAAMGELAVGERRYGAERPAKSALLGLVAAALGIDRCDDDRHLALGRALAAAVLMLKQAPLITDYHTVQAPPARKGKRWVTRREELADPDLGTVVSFRDYRADACVVVALWSRPDGDIPPWPALEEVATALRRPAYTLYFGRKSCPLGRPPAPEVVEAPTLSAAFRTYEILDAERSGRKPSPLAGTLYAEPDAGPRLGEDWCEDRVIRRRDEVVSRRRWQFGLRDELVAVTTA